MHMRVLPALIGALAAIAASLEVRDTTDVVIRAAEPMAEPVEVSSGLEARAPKNLPKGWSVVNQCVQDEGKNRVFLPKKGVLPKLSLQRNVLLKDNTPAACAALCAKTNFPYAAVRMGVECWCSNQTPKVVAKNKKQCSQPCSGDNKQTCGSFSTSQVYVNWSLANKKRPAVGKPNLPNGWTVAFKCVADPTVGEKFLKGTRVFELQNNTPFACAKLCGQKGYELAGVEYSNECMCGHDWKGAALPVKKDEKECNMSCTGDKTLTCGAGHRVFFMKHKHFRRFNTTLAFDDMSWE